LLTAQELVTLACQICKCPGRLFQAGQLLNIILANHAQTEDLDTIRKTATLNIQQQAIIPFFYPLPSDYLRMYDIFYNINGVVIKPEQWPLETLDEAYTSDGIDNYPYRYATDMSDNPQPTAGSSPSITFYAPPAIPLVLTLRYRPQTSDITRPDISTTVPWFPNQFILLKELCAELGDITDDDRISRWLKQAEDARRKYLMMDDDQTNRAVTVKLDPNTFSNTRKLPPSKILGF